MMAGSLAADFDKGDTEQSAAKTIEKCFFMVVVLKGGNFIAAF
jgi:hypothetical protein